MGAVILSFWAVSDMAAQHEFSGTWVLDKARTHGLASELKSYTMVVAQTESELAVQTGWKAIFDRSIVGRAMVRLAKAVLPLAVQKTVARQVGRREVGLRRESWLCAP